MSKSLYRLASKLENKYAEEAQVEKTAQQAAPAPVVPAAANTNYVGFMDAYQKLLTNSVSGLGQANVSKVLEIVMPYKTNAAATSPENAQAVVKAVAAQLNDVQANLNALKQFANSILASS